MKEFWLDSATEASWNELMKLSKETDFVLIGGWAVFLWSRRQKSRDIDLVVNYETLSWFKEHYDLTKNERLKKYEVKKKEFDIGVYTPFYSDLVIPPQDILKKFNTRIEGIKTVASEPLLALKQSAYAERRESGKGLKDELDILNLLFYAGVDYINYNKLLEKYELRGYASELINLLKGFDAKRAQEYLGVSFKEFVDWKKKTIQEITSIK